MAKDAFHGIEYEYEGTTYRFDYTLDSAAAANADGFVLSELGDKIALMAPKLVYFALAHNHKGINRKKAEVLILALLVLLVITGIDLIPPVILAMLISTCVFKLYAGNRPIALQIHSSNKTESASCGVISSKRRFGYGI